MEYRNLATTVFKKAIKLPAYKQFLEKAGFKKAERVNFEHLPVMDKANYIRAYDFTDRIGSKKVPSFIYASSGSSGKSTFWHRGHELDQSGSAIHEYIFKNCFQLKKQDPTLVVICFSMGIWVAGVYTMDCSRLLADQGWNISTITPGIDKESILELLRELAPYYKNIVLAGHPPFLMNTLGYLQSANLDLKKKCYLLTAGDKISETWRDSALETLGTPGDLSRVMNLYGASDTGVIAHETLASISVRRLARNNSALAEKLFGGVALDPALFQYNPRYTYLEEIKGELVITKDTACPLVRYNIHDLGRVFSYEEVLDILKETGSLNPGLKNTLSRHKFPFVVKGGRSDVAVTYYAMNLYPEQLLAWRNSPLLQKSTTGTFGVFRKTNKAHASEKLEFVVELSPKVTKNPQRLKTTIASKIVDTLKELSPEFRKMISALGKFAEPSLTLVPFGTPVLSKQKVPGITFTEGKKPRIIF